MSNCRECAHFHEEPFIINIRPKSDINYQDCSINEDEKYWFTDIDCQNFTEMEVI